MFNASSASWCRQGRTGILAMHRSVQSASGSYMNLQALLNDDAGGGADLTGGGPLSFSAAYGRASRASIDSSEIKKQSKCVLLFLCCISSWMFSNVFVSANLSQRDRILHCFFNL